MVVRGFTGRDGQGAHGWVSAGRAQFFQHLGRWRAHTAPEGKRLGGLLHQHAQAVARHGAVLARPVQKALRGGAVHHVVGQAAGAQHAGGHGHGVARQAAGGGVDDDIKIAL
jgi:hypothetical protein